MGDVYIAPEPRSDGIHQCDYPGTYDPARPVGSIWRCNGCGQYWYKYSMKGIGLLSPARNWEKVRWWNFKYKRLIRMLATF